MQRSSPKVANEVIYTTAAMGAVLVGLFWAVGQGYLFFHILAELFSVVVAAGVFMVAWNSRRFHEDSYLTLLGVGFVFVAGLDLLHTLSYKGMAVLPGYDSNLPTQFWIAARYLESASLLAATLMIGRPVRGRWLLAAFAAVFVLLVLAIFGELFPACYIEGRGLTGFKRLSEFIICGLILAAIVQLWRRRAALDRYVYRLLLAALCVTIAQELAFTLYRDPYSTWNFTGHCLKILAFVLVYKAIVQTGLARPYRLLFFDLKQREQALQESERQYRLLFAANPNPMFVFEEESLRFLAVNDIALRQYGWSLEEFLSMTVLDIRPAEDRAFARRVIEQNRGTVETNIGVFRHCRKDGAVMEMEIVASAIQFNGRPARLCSMTDVTERRRAEEALRRYELLAGNSRDIILFVDRLSGRILEANAAAIEAYGYSREELLERTIQDLRAVETHDIMPVQMAEADHAGTRFETVHRRRDGSVFPVEVASQGATLGHVRTLISVARDISERKRADAALQTALHRFYTVLSSMYSAILLVTDDGRVEFVNPAFCRDFGLTETPAELVGHSATEVVAKLKDAYADSHEADQRIREIVERGQPVKGEEVALRDGRTCLRDFIPLQVDGKRHGRAWFHIDITERKQIERDRQQLLEAERAARAELERVNRMKDEFLSMLSHELRSPLSAVLGWTRLLRRGKAEDADRALGIVETNAQVLAQMIDDMLDIGRIMSGKVRLSIQDAEPRSLIGEVVEAFRPAIEAKGITLRDDYEDDLGVLSCDPARVRQVISNLLSNAQKFTGPDGVISLRARRRGRGLQIIVRDTGQGIAREFLPHLFDKFLQADSSSTRKHGGLGLGLAIVKQIVDLHGGTVRAASAGENRGAVFVVSLPCTDVSNAVKPSELKLSVVDDGLELPTGMDILLVDDDPEILSMMSRVLADSGARVLVAASVPDGLRLFEECRPALVVSDISMPGDDGYSLVRRLREMDPPGVHTICVAVTALARPEDRERALAMGFDEHLSKLTDPTTIVRVVRGLVVKSMLRMYKRERARTSTPSPEGTSGHILVAEDSEVVSGLIKECLEAQGFRVTVVGSVARAVEVARHAPPDLLLSDLRLEDGTGWELLAKLRENHTMPAIMMSGYSEETYRSQSQQAGFDEYLVKPVDPDVLCERVARLVAQPRAARG